MDLFDLIRLGIRFGLTTNLGEVYLMNYLHTESVKHFKLKNNVSSKGTNVAIVWLGRTRLFQLGLFYSFNSKKHFSLVHFYMGQTRPLSQFNDKYNKQTWLNMGKAYEWFEPGAAGWLAQTKQLSQVVTLHSMWSFLKMNHNQMSEKAVTNFSWRSRST